MVNRANRSGDLPTLNLQRGQSADISTPNYTSDLSPGFRQIAAAADQFGQRLQGMAERAAVREGRDAAAADVLAGRLSPKDEATIFGQAYGEVARDALGAQRRAALAETMGEAANAYGDNPGELAKALDAARAGMASTGYVDLDAALDNQFRLDRANHMVRADAGARKALADTARANFRVAFETGQQLVDRTAASAAFDAAGGERVTQALAALVTDLAKYGPKEEFEIAGQVYAADPARTGALSADQIAQAALAAQAQARTGWVLAHADTLQGSAAKRAFVTDLRQRWTDGDPMLVGIDAERLEALTRTLEADTNRSAIDERAAVTGAGQRARDLIEAMRYGGDVDPRALMAAAEASGDPGLIAQARWSIEVGVAPPGGGGAGGGFDGDAVAPGYTSAADFVIDVQEGGETLVEDDNGRGASRYGINQAAHPDLDVRNLTRPQATQRLRRYWNSIDGDRLPPALALIAFDGAVNHGEAKARQLLAASGGDPSRLLQLREAEYRRLAETNPARHGDDLAGWLKRLDRVRSQAARVQAFANTQEGFSSDPLKFALGGSNRPALASVPALDPAATGDPAWGEALRARRATGRALADQYRVPARMLTDAETTFYRDAIAADPAEAVRLAGAAVGAVGADGARQLLREIGRDGGGVEIHIADLAALGNASIATAAIEGLRLKAEGAKAPPYESGADTVAQLATRYAPALANEPGVLAAAIETAELARLADAQKGRARPASYYLQGALGAQSQGGKTFGGVANLNGKATLLPEWLAAEDAAEVLQEIGASFERTGRGPVYDNGEPMRGRTIAQLQMVSLPNGRYGLVRPSTGAVVRGRNGAPYEVDLDAPAMRDFVRRVLPGAVLRGR